MKLRIRSLESKEDLRIKTPSPCSLQELKDAIAEKISSLPEILHLSLNRKDEIHCSSPEESLHSLGVSSGDLIFYTLSPNGFSGETLVRTPTMQETPRIQEGETVGLSERIDETPDEFEMMDIDNESVAVGKSCSVPCFLSKVFKVVMGNANGDRNLLVIAVHAVMLESGFVGFDFATEKKIDGFHLPEAWASTDFTVCLRYTLPGVMGSGFGSDLVETIDLKFQVLEKFVSVYGSLTRMGSDSYRVCLDESRFVPSINFVGRNFDSKDAMSETDGSSKSSHEREVFEFWKIVKDGIALPLLIDLCERTGLAPPPCFMRLPTELKIGILGLLPGVDIAKVGCISSELRYLSSHDDLWKQRFVDEFGRSGAEKIQGGSHWKKWFAVIWEMRNKKKGRVPCEEG